MVDFEKFTHRKSKSFGKPTVAITKNGSFNINSIAMLKYVGYNEYAVFYYDKKNYLIGIKFVANENPEAYKIRKARKGKLGYITGIAFLKYYEISYEKTQTYQIEWNEQQEMLIIDLKEHMENVPAPDREQEREDEIPF